MRMSGMVRVLLTRIWKRIKSEIQIGNLFYPSLMWPFRWLANVRFLFQDSDEDELPAANGERDEYSEGGSDSE
jgi:hypothetical protein